MQINHYQIRAGRALAGLASKDFAEQLGITPTYLGQVEKGKKEPSVALATAARALLESAGVIFVPENGEGAGVRLRKGEG